MHMGRLFIPAGFYLMENGVIECIKARRSIRNYEDREVPKEVMEEIILAGRYAPSAENHQPWKFIVVTDRDAITRLSNKTKEQIGKMLEHKRKWKKKFKELDDPREILFFQAVASSSKDMVFHDAPAVVFIVTADGIFNDEACACAAQNMMLAACSLGVGSCWIGFAKFIENSEIMEEMGMPEGYHIAACIAFGYAGNSPKAAIRKPMADVIKWI